MLTLFESRYTLKGRYNIGNSGKTAFMTIFIGKIDKAKLIDNSKITHTQKARMLMDDLRKRCDEVISPSENLTLCANSKSVYKIICTQSNALRS